MHEERVLRRAARPAGATPDGRLRRIRDSPPHHHPSYPTPRPRPRPPPAQLARPPPARLRYEPLVITARFFRLRQIRRPARARLDLTFGRLPKAKTALCTPCRFFFQRILTRGLGTSVILPETFQSRMNWLIVLEIVLLVALKSKRNIFLPQYKNINYQHSMLWRDELFYFKMAFNRHSHSRRAGVGVNCK